MKWESVRLADLYEVHNGLSKSGKFFGSGFPFLTFSTVFNNFFIPDELKDLVQSTDSERENYSIRRGDIFVTRTSETSDELGMSCVALKDYPNATYNGFTKRMRPITDRVVPEYVGYYMRTPCFRGEFLAFSTMTTRASLRNEDLLSLSIPLPPIEIQKKIANILSSYDDLIENNQKQIKLLEEAAQRIYKEWFVDLRFPGYETNPIVNGIPEGWEGKNVTDLLEIKYGKDHKALADGTIPVYGSGGVMRKVDRILYSRESVLIPRKGSLNNIIYVSGDFWTIDTMFYSIPRIPNIAKYMYLFLSCLDMYSFNIGAAVPSMTVNILDGINVLLPESFVLDRFESVISPLFRKMELLKKQSEIATETRDRLLPKLMNGEIEV